MRDNSRLAAVNRLRNEDFGFVFQQFFLTPNATVLDNVILPLKIAGVGPTERKARGMAALEQLELADKAKNKAINLSGGQKQRVVIARALVNNPKVIFADEPTGNLDTATGKLVEDILFDLNRENGITLVIVTHDVELAERCDRQLFLRDGVEDPTQEARCCFRGRREPPEATALPAAGLPHRPAETAACRSARPVPHRG